MKEPARFLARAALAAARRLPAAALLAWAAAAAAAPASTVSVHPLEDPYARAPAPQAAPAVAPRSAPVALPAAAPTSPGVASADAAASGRGDATAAYRIGRGDELNFRFVHLPELSTVAQVRADGTVSLPLLGELTVAGSTLREVTERVQGALATRVRRPDLVINVQGSLPSQRVFIGGEVARPGVQPLAGSLTVLQAVLAADGLKDTAQPREVAVLRAGPGGRPQRIRVDLQALMEGGEGAADVALAPYDVVIVPRSGIANVGLWVDQYIRRVIPISFGLNYSFGRTTP